MTSHIPFRSTAPPKECVEKKPHLNQNIVAWRGLGNSRWNPDSFRSALPPSSKDLKGVRVLFDKSRHLCLQAFPTSILVNELSLDGTYPSLVSTVSGVNHSPRGTSSTTVLYVKAWKKKSKCSWGKANSPTCGVQSVFIYLFFYVTLSETLLSLLLSWKPPVESTHHLRDAVRCPGCWNVCAYRRCNKTFESRKRRCLKPPI